MATIGLYSMVATLLWGRFVFGIDVPLEHPLLFVLSVLATVVSIGAAGVPARGDRRCATARAWALGTALEEPVWLICGFLVPIAIAARLGAADLLAARPDLGRAGDPGVGAGRDAVARHRCCAWLVGARLRRGRGALRRAPCCTSARAQRHPGADVSGVGNALRIFFIGGLTSYRALFNWLRPWILIPTFLVGPDHPDPALRLRRPRRRRRQSDEFFVIGNAMQYAAIPCLFAMGNTIGDERQPETLGLILVDPGAADPAVPRPGAAGHRQRLGRLAVRAGRRRR